MALLTGRNKTRQIKVGSVLVGGDAPISVQSMTTTRTREVDETLQQISSLHAAGCDIIRVAVPLQSDIDALPAICERSPIPVIADVHFRPDFVFESIKAGCAAVRVNPGNLRDFHEIGGSICEAAAAAGVSLRIGVNAGSLDPKILEKFNGQTTPEALVESARAEAAMFERFDFHDFKISVKHHDPVVMIKAYELLSQAGDWPLHLGVTEAGPAFQGTVKSATAFGALLANGIGDTIRVSLSADPVEEVKVGCSILQSLGLRQRGFEIISCPTCGRKEADVIRLAAEVEAALGHIKEPLRVAVMGCIVNGPGEAREADLGVAGGAGKGIIFVKGEVVEKVDEADIIPTLVRIADRVLAERSASNN